MIQVSEKVFRGPHAHPLDLAKKGIKKILILEAGVANVGDSDPLDETLHAYDCGMRIYPCPLGGILPPPRNILVATSAFLRWYTDEPTYVHCKKGVDRTGMVIAAYRVTVQGWKPKDAAREAIRNGMHFVYWWWLIQLWRLK